MIFLILLSCIEKEDNARNNSNKQEKICTKNINEKKLKKLNVNKDLTNIIDALPEALSQKEQGNIDNICNMLTKAINLVEKGADPNILSSLGEKNLLQYIIQSNDIYKDRQKLLSDISTVIEKGIDVNNISLDDNISLHLAISYKLTDVAKLLLKSGANIELKNYNGSTPLILAAEFAEEELVGILVQKRANVNVSDKYGRSALEYGVLSGSMKIVNLLIDIASKEYKNKALIYAAQNGNIDMVKLLLSKNVDIDFKDLFNKTALIYAVENRHRDVVELLVPKSSDNQLGKALLKLISVNDVDITLLEMLAIGSSINYKENNSLTPLCIAVLLQKTPIIKLLLEKGADKDIVFDNGKKAIDYARSDEVKELLQ